VALRSAVPALPVRDSIAAVAFYRGRFGFESLHADTSMAVLRRDAVELHLWTASDDSWRQRDALVDQPVRSGAENFIAGTASCRLEVEGIDVLYDELSAAGVLHPRADKLHATQWGTREFATLDLDGNLLTFFQRVRPA
jgi:uncharacterized glyoxalase superfamily protein PhnB